MSKIRPKDYTKRFSSLVSFNSNRYKSVHRWYSLVEGYSSEFVRRIIGEQQESPKVCFDPFGGVGTTALTCQELGIKCYSFENNPFIFDVAITKLRTDFDSFEFDNLINEFEFYLSKCRKNQKLPEFESKNFFEKKDSKKWIFNKPVSNGVLDILYNIENLERAENKYFKLFKISLSTLLVPLSNVYRNGKCLSYKKDWKLSKTNRKEVHKLFIDYCREVILVDIRTRENKEQLVHNHLYFSQGDSRKLISTLPDDSIDIVITSPPYLNSRDYTDIYRVELWILGYLKKYNEERLIRKSALTSHVQITLEDFEAPNNLAIKKFVKHLYSLNGGLWNKNIPNMVKGYFCDMENLLKDLRPKMKLNSKVYINVSNSAYGGKVCEVDKILIQLATLHGFEYEELRIARYISSSKQQNLENKLRESIIVLKAI